MSSRLLTLFSLFFFLRQLRSVLIFSALLSIGLQSASAAQSPCGRAHTLLPSTNPAYADAMELAQTLRSRGFVVKCVLLSVEERMFEGQEGAANYQTDVGVFEALFLPKSQSFDALQIIEEEETGGFIYSFRGSPRSVPEHWEGIRHVYFVKQESQLLHTLDQQLAVKLEDAFQTP
jgi:hypothetical protein